MNSRILDPTSPEAGKYVQTLLQNSASVSLNDLEKDAVFGIQKARKQVDQLQEKLREEVIRVEKQVEYHQGEFNAYFIQLINEENRRREKMNVES